MANNIEYGEDTWGEIHKRCLRVYSILIVSKLGLSNKNVSKKNPKQIFPWESSVPLIPPICLFLSPD